MLTDFGKNSHFSYKVNGELEIGLKVVKSLHKYNAIIQ